MADRMLVVFSGGQDSTTTLLWAFDQFGRDNVQALTFDYGQRHAAEIEAAKQIAGKLGIAHRVVDLSLLHELTENALTRPDIQVEAGTEGVLPSTFVDGRNLLFLSFAAIIAKQQGIHHLATGVSQTDFSGYPDCRNDFVVSLQQTLRLAMDYEFFIHTPLMWIDKKATWALADKLGGLDLVRYETVTCYEGIPAEGCGECPACILRNQGLQAYLQERDA